MRSIECGPSHVLVKQTNSFRIDNKDRCTIHLNLSVSHAHCGRATHARSFKLNHVCCWPSWHVIVRGWQVDGAVRTGQHRRAPRRDEHDPRARGAAGGALLHHQDARGLRDVPRAPRLHDRRRAL